MSTRECWLLGCRVHTAMREEPGADVILAWRPLPDYAPVLLGKKRAANTDPGKLTVRPATDEDMPAIRGLYAMTGGRAVLLPVREGLWTADGAWVAEEGGKPVAYCLGSAADGLWNIYEWGVNPETDVAQAASAFAAHNGCHSWQLRAEFAPGVGGFSTGECVHIGVPKPFLLGSTLVQDAQQLAGMIDAAQV